MEHYIMRTERYLKTYEKMQAESKILAEDIRLQEYLLRTESIQGIKYGGEIGGGTSELTVIEAAALHRMEVEREIEDMKGRKEKLDGLLEKISCAMSWLPKDDANIVRERYIRGRSWKSIAHVCNYTERGARKKAQRAVEEIADILFPMETKRKEIRLL